MADSIRTRDYKFNFSSTSRVVCSKCDMHFWKASYIHTKKHVTTCQRAQTIKPVIHELHSMDSQCRKNVFAVFPMDIPLPAELECDRSNQPRDVLGVNECKGQESDPGADTNAVPENTCFSNTQLPSDPSTKELQLIPLIDDFLQVHDVPDALSSLLFQEIERNAARLQQAESPGDVFDAKCSKCLNRFTSKQLQQDQHRQRKYVLRLDFV